MLFAVGEIKGIIICAVSVFGLLGVDIVLYALNPNSEDCDDDSADEDETADKV